MDMSLSIQIYSQIANGLCRLDSRSPQTEFDHLGRGVADGLKHTRVGLLCSKFLRQLGNGILGSSFAYCVFYQRDALLFAVVRWPVTIAGIVSKR